jgi:hypothetical protein
MRIPEDLAGQLHRLVRPADRGVGTWRKWTSSVTSRRWAAGKATRRRTCSWPGSSGLRGVSVSWRRMPTGRLPSRRSFALEASGASQDGRREGRTANRPDPEPREFPPEADRGRSAHPSRRVRIYRVAPSKPREARLLRSPSDGRPRPVGDSDAAGEVGASPSHGPRTPLGMQLHRGVPVERELARPLLRVHAFHA